MKRKNENYEIKLGAISGIDDEILERTSKKRFELWGRIKKRNPVRVWAPVVAGAACIALLSGWLIGILPTLGKVPVYEGMTVSNTYPMVQAKAETENGINSWLFAWKSEQPLMGSAMKNFPKPNILLSPETDRNSETEAPDLLGENRALYYAKKNEDIYITVHLKNPEAYEILSFTLNGIKYQSYMFEAGSDSEQLILKVNVGEAQGLTEYTIDAIKYVDGTAIKDVRMEGDRTVTVAVYPEDQPTPEVTNMKIDYEKISFDVTVKDTFSLIKDSKGRALARLYLKETEDDEQESPVEEGTVAEQEPPVEGTIVAEQELSLEGATSVTLKGLTPGLSYTLCIMAEYDSMDGAGFSMHQIHKYESEIITKSHVVFSEILGENGSISFVLQEERSAMVEKVELIDSRNQVVQSGDGSLRDFHYLSLGEYTVKVTYSYGESGAKTGYVTGNAMISKMCSLTDILKGATIVYSETDHREVGITTEETDKRIYAPYSGTVIRVHEAGTIAIALASEDEGVITFISGLSSVKLAEGDKVVGGQLLGIIRTNLSIENFDVACFNEGFPYDDEHRISCYFATGN